VDVLFGAFAGLGAGAVFAILGVGLVVAYRGSGVINFAHGAVAAYTAFTWDELRNTTRGAYVKDDGGSIFLPWFDPIPEWGFLKALHINNLPVEIYIMNDPPVWLAALLSLAMAAFIGFLMHIMVFRPLRNAPLLAKVIGSVGVMLYLQSVANLNFGGANRADNGFWEFTSTNEPIRNFLGMDRNLAGSTLYLAVAALIIGTATWALYRFTRFGLATRAADENEKGATLLGYSPQLLAGLNWVISSVLAGAIGILFIHRAGPPTFILFVVPALAAALVGSLTSIMGALAGGFGIGMIASMGVNATSYDWWPEWLPSDGVRTFAPVLVMILVLYFRGDRLPIRGTVGVGRQPRAPFAKHPLVGLGIGIGIVVLMSNIFTANWESTLTTTLLSIMFMLSLTVLVGFLGQISLVQWSLAGFACWTLIRLSADGTKIRAMDFLAIDGPGWPDPLAALAAIIAAVILGVLISIPALRIRGVQLAVVTLAAVVAIEDLLLRNEPLMGAGAATTNPTPDPNWFGVEVGALDEKTFRTDYWKYTIFALIFVAIGGLIVANLRRGILGRRFLAIRSNERAAAAAGVDVARTKMIGFGVSSLLAGMAGILVAYKVPVITSEYFNPFVGLGFLAFVYLGGITTVWGAIFGGLLAAGGIISEFGSLHFEGITQAYINAVGAIGLVINAIVTNGEGVALMLTNRSKEMTGVMRGTSSSPNEVSGSIDANTQEVS